MKKHLLISLAGLCLALGWADNTAAEPPLISVTLGTQWPSTQCPSTISPGDSATYPVVVARTGSGELDAYLSISGLPAGATASFSPQMVSFTGNSPACLTSTLTITTASSLPAGRYRFTVTATVGQSHNKRMVTGELMVGLCHVDLALWPDGSVHVGCAGMPGQVYLLQAATNPASPSWTTLATNVTDASGWFVWAAMDATNYQSRFYRLLTP